MQFTVTDLDDIFSTARVDLIFSVRDPQLGNFALTRMMIGHQVTPSLGHSLALRYWPMLSRLFQRRGWPPGQVNHAQSYQIIRGWTLGTPQRVRFGVRFVSTWGIPDTPHFMGMFRQPHTSVEQKLYGVPPKILGLPILNSQLLVHPFFSREIWPVKTQGHGYLMLQVWLD
jgi:hypothetical protein